jgi:hypothetical protein
LQELRNFAPTGSLQADQGITMKPQLAGVGTLILMLLGNVPQVVAQDYRGAVTCAELNWSPQVLAANPDIALACRGVFEKDDILYAQALIEVVRVKGNIMTFRTQRTDGSLGKLRTVNLKQGWRVQLDGREYRASDLLPGQQLRVYMPQDKFGLALEDDDGPDAAEVIEIE